MNYYPPLVSALVAFVLVIFLTRNKNGKLIDIPNERSLHTKPTPRTGGIALVAGIFSGWLMLIQFWAWWFVLPALGLFVLSLADDMRSLSARTRLIGHFIAASAALLGAGMDWFWLLPVLLYIVWMTNLYNFMDGSDGMAGGMTVFGFSFYGIAGLLNGNEPLGLLNFSIGAAALGFLLHNFPPAKVFMGDAGSIPLGFLAGIFGVWGWQQGLWPFWFPLMVFSPFVADATVTLLMRTRRGEKITQAHRSHYYQRLVQMGWSHRNTALAAYVLMFLSGSSALWGKGFDAKNQALLLLFWCAIYYGLMNWIDRYWRKHEAMQEKLTRV